ncbi:SixA phosphatase family protein [Neorhizobium alkalisoli]|uniref:SixA phosphatase family protein n=1 Tax=Neorhizobium alkalisoli TaxID=528178 RepID=UPI000CF8DDBB|nr:histidine phosphatase family protein [Neorhizobium alkalisoli]
MESDASGSELDRDARRLLLLRHAKSAWPDGVADHERPLAERGRKAAPLMGEYMAREGVIPSLALVSDARRTQETWALVRNEILSPLICHDCPAIYEASATAILAELRRIEPEFRTVLIVGHNPGLQDLALTLAGSGNAEAMQAIADKYPTGALAVIDFALPSWQAVSPGSGFLERFVKPRSLR